MRWGLICLAGSHNRPGAHSAKVGLHAGAQPRDWHDHGSHDSHYQWVVYDRTAQGSYPDAGGAAWCEGGKLRLLMAGTEPALLQQVDPISTIPLRRRGWCYLGKVHLCAIGKITMELTIGAMIYRCFGDCGLVLVKRVSPLLS